MEGKELRSVYQLVGRCLRRESPECGGSLLSSAVVLNWVPSSPHPVLKQQAPHLYEQRGKNTFSKMDKIVEVPSKYYLILGVHKLEFPICVAAIIWVARF